MNDEKRTGLRKLLLLAFVISGMTALMYEILWVRQLQLVFGSTIYAVSTLLTTFMAGYVLGSFFFRNIADRARNPVLLFSFLELGIGIYGIVIIALFKVLPHLYLSMLEIPGFQFFQFTLGFMIIIIPATLFGATWPVVNKAYVKRATLGRDTGKLYSFNSLGAVFGSIGAGFLFIPWLGLMRTSLLASILNLLIATAIIIIWRRYEN